MTVVAQNCDKIILIFHWHRRGGDFHIQYAPVLYRNVAYLFIFIFFSVGIKYIPIPWAS